PEENYKVLATIKKCADDADRDMVGYISMAFGNPYGDPWSEDELGRAMRNVADLGIRSISLADTVGMATLELIGHVVSAVTCDYEYEIGVHMHSTSADATAKVLAAYDAGCRRFD